MSHLVLVFVNSHFDVIVKVVVFVLVGIPSGYTTRRAELIPSRETSEKVETDGRCSQLNC